MIQSAYLAAEEYEAPLAEELALAGVAISGWHGRLALSPDLPRPSVWALDVWTAPTELDAPTIKSAADALRAMQRNWSLYAAAHYRRCALIEGRLPPLRAKPAVFPQAPPASHLGAWTLLKGGQLLASPTKSSPYPNGVVRFVEDRVGPPSRAYLKLWEAWTRMGVWPQPGETCIDLGASPGGWTWAAASLGARVIAVDRSPLNAEVTAMPSVDMVLGSAFTIEPQRADWLLCDVIAYPDRILSLVKRWIEAGAPNRIVCTVKLQGETDHAAIAAFGALPGATLMHLGHNKHELTFIWERPRAC